MSPWGRLGRWFLKGRISLLALVLRMPVMQLGQLAESSLFPRNPALHQACVLPPPASAFPSLSSIWRLFFNVLALPCPHPTPLQPSCSSSPWSLCLSDAPPCDWTAPRSSGQPCPSPSWCSLHPSLRPLGQTPHSGLRSTSCPLSVSRSETRSLWLGIPRYRVAWKSREGKRVWSLKTYIPMPDSFFPPWCYDLGQVSLATLSLCFLRGLESLPHWALMPVLRSNIGRAQQDTSHTAGEVWLLPSSPSISTCLFIFWKLLFLKWKPVFWLDSQEVVLCNDKDTGLGGKGPTPGLPGSSSDLGSCARQPWGSFGSLAKWSWEHLCCWTHRAAVELKEIICVINLHTFQSLSQILEIRIISDNLGPISLPVEWKS